jgi:hypothetical protein
MEKLKDIKKVKEILAIQNNTRYEYEFHDQKNFTYNKQLLISDIAHDTLKSLFIDCLRQFEPKLKIDKHLDKIITLLIHKIQLNTKFENTGYSLSKGIILMGGVGTGKTLILKTFETLIRSFSYYTRNETVKMGFKLLPTYKVVEMYNSSGTNIFSNNQFHYLARNTVGLDDLGAEAKGIHFGNSSNVIAELILRRYDYFIIQRSQNRTLTTLATTNLNRELLKEFYGSRVYSRMCEMFNFLVLDGKDHRIN